MRRTLVSATLLAAFAAACVDNSPTGTLRPPSGGPALSTLTLAQEVDKLIIDLFPQGLETATGSRWSTVKERKAAGDMAGATKHYLVLADWIKKKTPDIDAPAGETKDHAATRLVYAMSLWLFVSPDAPLPNPGTDSKFAIVPAGAAARVVTDTKRAGVDIDALSTREDRVILIAEDERRYDGLCDGPLVTTRCQVPVFYRFESFPHLRLDKKAHFSVCIATIGKRRPLDYVDATRGNTQQVHQRMALAHDKPADPADYTPGSTIEDGIEILPLVPGAEQRGITECEKDIDYLPPTVVGGVFGRAQQLLLAMGQLAGRMLTPKNLYAYDSGPEHFGLDFSHFNGVDVGSQADLAAENLSAPSAGMAGTTIAVSFVVTNTSRRSGGEATGTSTPVSADITLSRSGDTQSETASSIALDHIDNIPALHPDDRYVITRMITLPLSAAVLNAPTGYNLSVSITPSGGHGEVSTVNNTSAVPIMVNPLNFGFENGEPAWDATGFWNRTDGVGISNAAFSSGNVATFVLNSDGVPVPGGALAAPFAGSYAMWYGQPATGNFLGTASNAGSATSPSFVIPENTSVVLGFKTWWEIEAVNPSHFDLMQVELLDAAGQAHVLRRLNPASDPSSEDDLTRLAYTSGGFNTAPTWQDVSLDLSAYGGQAVRIRFAFNTGDGRYNNFRGWLVDEVGVRIQSLARARLSVDTGDEKLAPADQAIFPARP